MLPLLCLHGALGHGRQLQPLLDHLPKQRCLAPDLPGHGSGQPAERLEMAVFADAMIRLLDAEKIESANIFGYSMGGYLALYMARHFPERVNAVFTVSTKFAWSLAAAKNEVRFLDPDAMLAKVPKFAAHLEAIHGSDRWRHVLRQTADMMIRLGEDPGLSPDDFAEIGCKVVLCTGDLDQTATTEETASTFRHLRDGRLVVLPETGHPFERLPLPFIARCVQNFVLDQPLLSGV